jgi:hypothetical protein
VSYLIDAGPFPITAADIRAELGLVSDRLDPLFGAAIAAICLNGKRPLRRETWMERPENIGRYGEPVKTGPLHAGMGRDTNLYRDCVYEPTAAEIATARQRVLAWCIDQTDVADAIAAERDAQILQVAA